MTPGARHPEPVAHIRHVSARRDRSPVQLDAAIGADERFPSEERAAQIAVFFGLYLGVVQNQEMKYFTRYNAQQAVLLDILLIVPDVLARLASGLGGDDALLTGGPGLEIQVLMYNTVFLYVYLCSVVGVGASALGKNVKLPLVGDAAESQTNMR